MSEIEDSISWALSGYYNASGKSERDGIETFVNIYPNAITNNNELFIIVDSYNLIEKPQIKLYNLI